MNENPTLTLELSLVEINVVLNALQELPAKLANPLTAKITEQAKKQLPNQEQPEASSEIEETGE